MPHSIGIIDQDYSGNDDEILIQVQNVTDTAVTIERGERVAQGLFMAISTAEWEEIDSMNKGSRGGIGSTGGYTAEQSTSTEEKS